MTPFVHLHCHSDFSLLDGASSVEALVAKAKEDGMEALALTDHGNMFGVMKFAKECAKQGVRPIFGSEFYVAGGSRLEKTGTEKGSRRHHLVLLARNLEGYKNLMYLSSIGYTEGFYYKPRIDDDALASHHEGIVALTACLAGEIPSLIVEDRLKDARKKVDFYAELFGRGSFFLELQDHGIPEQRKVNKELVAISRETGIPVVATNDTHYIVREDARAQDILICIGTNKKLNEEKRLKFEHPEFYFKSGDQMAAVFKEIPEAVSNTLVVADGCRAEMPSLKPQFPVYEVPVGFTPEGYLTDLARKGLAVRYPHTPPEAAKRLEYELSIITSMGFTGYFLIVWDFIRFAKDHAIAVGPGRGSGAGSLVAYCLRITDIDPLRYGLLFERFLNPERVSMPDFDIDFCHRRREEVISYVTQKYGVDKVGQVITFGTLKARAVIRDVARVLDFPYEEADMIAKLVPEGPKTDLTTALKENPKLDELAKKSEKYRDLIETSMKLEGLHRHASTHAAGIVIGREQLTRYVPLYRDPKTGAVSTQFTMDYLEECGLIKMDFLGLKTLTVIEDAVSLIRKKGVELDLKKIPENDTATFKMFCEGKSTGAFQFESTGMQGVLKRAKPGKIEDLIALNALYRPGAMEHIDSFIESKSGRRKIEYPLPALEPVLRETYGVPVYQEQVMQIAQVVAGFTLGQADILRRAMGKKKPEEMLKMKEMFFAGAKKKGYDSKIADRIFELLFAFTGYGFNKSHAAAYAIPAYHTIYLKANHPAEFLAANLTNDIADTDRIAELIRESREMGIDVLPPDINLSQKDFTVEGGRIVYGLQGIKNVGSAAVDAVIAERNACGPFKGFQDFFERIDLRVVNRKTAEALVITGAFDSFGETRATLMHNLPRILEAAAAQREDRMVGQASLFGCAPEAAPAALPLERLPEWAPAEKLANEKENLGFFFSGHPLDPFMALIGRHVNADLSRKEELTADRGCTLIGMLHEVREIKTRVGRLMAFAKLEDLRGSIEVIFFSDVYEKKNELVKSEKIVAVIGKIDTAKGEAKVKADDVMEPGALGDKPAKAIHIKFRSDLGSEAGLHELKDYFLDNKGGCALYFHLDDAAGGAETVLSASAHIRISDSDAVMAKIREYPQVADVWKE